MPDTTTQPALYPKRSMRIIPWPDITEEGKMGYTLVMEWFLEDGTIEEDMRYQMGPEEFAALLASASEAATLTPTPSDFPWLANRLVTE